MTDEQVKQLTEYLMEFVRRVTSGTTATAAELEALPRVADVLNRLPRY